jgi:hypothetical protein
MFARYSRRQASAAKALYLVYAAKKRAETAPGVGSETDMFIMGPQPRTYDELRPEIIKDVATIYAENQKKSQRVYNDTERKVSEYIASIPSANSQPGNQQDAAAPDGTTSAQDATVGRPSLEDKSKSNGK